MQLGSPCHEDGVLSSEDNDDTHRRCAPGLPASMDPPTQVRVNYTSHIPSSWPKAPAWPALGTVKGPEWGLSVRASHFYRSAMWAADFLGKRGIGQAGGRGIGAAALLTLGWAQTMTHPGPFNVRAPWGPSCGALCPSPTCPETHRM